MADQTTSEVADQFARGAGRAEDLIQASRARYGPELREAQLQPKDEEASEELDWGKAASAADVDSDSVVDASVRGDWIVVAYETEDGRIHKKAVARDEKKAAKADAKETKKAEKKPSKTDAKKDED